MRIDISEQIRITVITVVFNAVNTIERTIRSVLDQDYCGLEYIIIDGGSTDGTVDIIKKYESKINYWISEPDNGIYDAMNKGLEKATGEWVHFLNADDSFAFETLKRISFYMKNTDADILHGSIFNVDGKQIYLRDTLPFDSIGWNMPICHQAIFMKNNSKMHFDTDYRLAADYKLLVDRYMAGSKIQYVPCVVAYYNINGSSTDWYLSNLEFTKIASDALLRSREDKRINRLRIIRNYLHNECCKQFENGENHEDIVRYISSITSDKENILVFGTGNIVDKLYPLIEKADVQINYYVDNDENKWGKELYGIPICSPEKLINEKNSLLVVLNEKYIFEIMWQINGMFLNPSIETWNYVSLKDQYLLFSAEKSIRAGAEAIPQFRDILRLENDEFSQMLN